MSDPLVIQCSSGKSLVLDRYSVHKFSVFILETCAVSNPWGVKYGNNVEVSF